MHQVVGLRVVIAVVKMGSLASETQRSLVSNINVGFRAI